MCGRYYMDENTAKEVQKLVQEFDRRSRVEFAGDICPSQEALVMLSREGKLCADSMEWGFPGFSGKGLLINARAESVLQKPTFQESVKHRRCVIPAKGFYEWNKSREKFTFEHPASPVLYMAGCYECRENRERFVILTTKANASMERVHDRMPLLLEADEIRDWLLDEEAARQLLAKKPPELRSGTEYEQLSLF